MATLYETIQDHEELGFDPIHESSWSAGASLSDTAKAIAPQFCESVLAGLGRSKLVRRQTESDLESLRAELQRWFIALFNPRNPDGHPQRVQFQIPLSFLLQNLDITLRYGRKVTAFSPHSEQLLSRFIRSLSDELAKRQVDVEQHLEYVSGLCLLD
jgi:hypothetical protein